MIFGIDVSSYQTDRINWTKVAAKNAFAILKASEGDRVLDPDRILNANGCIANNLPWGCYHFAHEELGDGATQAQLLFNACGGVMPDLGPMLDIESRKDADPMKTLQFVRDFVKGCCDTFGRAPLLYTGPSFWKGLGQVAAIADDLADCPLAVAQYPHLDGDWAPGPEDRPALFDPWNAWTIWQFSGSADNVDGIPAGVKCDRDVFNGTADDLRRLCGFPPSSAA